MNTAIDWSLSVQFDWLLAGGIGCHSTQQWQIESRASAIVSAWMGRSWRQTGAVALFLAALAALAYGSNAIHGGFLSDAWSNRAIYVFASDGGFSQELNQFLDAGVAPRPFYAVYLVALNAVFGSHMGFWLAWLGATYVLMSLAVYTLLRELDFAFFDAALIAALVLIFPASSSLGLWAAVVQIPIAVGLGAFGFSLALRAFNRDGRRRVALHCASLACFLASTLFYEAAIGLMLTSILLYRLRVPWQTAAKRWALDVVLLVSLVGSVAALSPAVKDTQNLAGAWAHATEIFDQAWMLLGTVVLPFASAGWYVLALLALPPLAAMLLLRRLPPQDPARAQLRRWLGVLVAGVVVVVLGYAVFIPGIDYYAPLGLGIANRVNAVPGIGFVLVLYALIALAATIAFRGLRDARRFSSTLVALACALIGIGWLTQIDQDSDNYTGAFREGERVRSVVATVIPDPTPNSTIWTFGQPVEMAPGIPVFGNTWDMTTAVQLLYDDPSIRSFVGFPGTTFECRPDAIVPGGYPEYTTTEPAARAALDSAYGLTYFVDTVSGRSELIQTPQACRAAAGEFPRSPYLPGELVAPASSPSSPQLPYRLGANGTALVTSDGQRIPVRAEAIAGYVDNVIPDGETINVTGWAAVENLTSPAEQVVGIVGRAEVAQAEPVDERPDVVEAFGQPALRNSGFVLSIETASLQCTAAASGLTIFGVAEGTAAPLTLVGNSEQQLEAAC